VDILSKYHKYLLVLALVFSSIAISIRGSDDEVQLILHDYPVIITLLITFSIFLVALYFQISMKKVSRLSKQIKEQTTANEEGFRVLVHDLTERQKEVYDLIVTGKTNKEIMAELFIEQSTLKSHINQLYKKLNIRNRRELKSRLRS
jgi:DNA-binding CsgD family transcriptional regulator